MFNKYIVLKIFYVEIDNVFCNLLLSNFILNSKYIHGFIGVKVPTLVYAAQPIAV